MSANAGTMPSRPTLQQFTLDDLAVYTAEQPESSTGQISHTKGGVRCPETSGQSIH